MPVADELSLPTLTDLRFMLSCCVQVSAHLTLVPLLICIFLLQQLMHDIYSLRDLSILIFQLSFTVDVLLDPLSQLLPEAKGHPPGNIGCTQCPQDSPDLS